MLNTPSFKQFVPLVHRRAGSILAIAVLVSGVAGWLALDILGTIKTDLADLLPRTYPSVQTLDRIDEKLGGLGILRIALECEDLPAAIAFAEALVCWVRTPTTAKRQIRPDRSSNDRRNSPTGSPHLVE